MIKADVGKYYYFELYNGFNFKGKVTNIKDVKIYLNNEKGFNFEFKDIRRIIEYWPYEEPEIVIITKELTFEDVKKLANDNGFELRQYGDGTRTTLYKTFPMKELKKHGLKEPLEFRTLQEVIVYFSPF